MLICLFSKSFPVVGGWVVHKVIIVSVRVLCVSLHKLKSFPVGGGPQSDYSVCPRPLRRVFDFSGFQVFGFSGFQQVLRRHLVLLAVGFPMMRSTLLTFSVEPHDLSHSHFPFHICV